VNTLIQAATPIQLLLLQHSVVKKRVACARRLTEACLVDRLIAQLTRDRVRRRAERIGK